MKYTNWHRYEYYVNDLPKAFKHYFTECSDIHSHPTRQMKDFNLTFNKKSFSDHSICTAGNSLEFTPAKSKIFKEY